MYVQPHSRDKHWEFFASEHAIRPVVEPVIAEKFTGEEAERNEQRAELLAGFVQTQIWCGGVDFHHDPEHGEDPDIVRADLDRALRRFFDGEHDQYEDVAAQPLFNDDFANPATVTALITSLVDAIADAVADGRIEVTADEPWDSCAGCGGYHNVNHDCAADYD